MCSSEYKFLWHPSDGTLLSVYSDDDKFVAELCAGVGGETLLSVGYSCPNGADMKYAKDEFYDVVKLELEKCWNNEPKLELDEMLPALYELCSVANDIYNRYST